MLTSNIYLFFFINKQTYKPCWFFLRNSFLLWKKSPISTKLWIRGFSSSLIANPISNSRISKWRIQYDGRQIKNSMSFSDSLYLAVFSKFKMVDPLWRTPNPKFHQFFLYLVLLGGFRGADYKSEIAFSKFEMANPIWLVSNSDFKNPR